MAINIGNLKTKVYLGNKNLNVYLGTKKIYPCGNIVTYYVDTENVYQEEVGEGESCLQPKNFTPLKSDWEFAGWRQDTTANGSVLNNLTMEDVPVTLYAVFKQDVTISYNGNENTGGATDSQTGTRYYNTGNYSNPSFVLRTNGFTRTSYTFTKWALGSAGGTQYASGTSITLAENTNMYAVWMSDVQETNVKIAPPFLSAGWKTITVYDGNNKPGWTIHTDESGRQYIGDIFSDFDQFFIQEDKIRYNLNVFDYGKQQAYIFYSPMLTIGSYTSFEKVEDIRYGGLTEDHLIARFSNDGTNWTSWFITKVFDKSYNYVQIGIFVGLEGDVDNEEVGVGVDITEIYFN